MSSLRRTVYRTADPEAVKSFTDWQDGTQRWHKALRKAMKDLGVQDRDAILSRGVGAARWVGITGIEPPPGWRYDKPTGCLVPYKKLPEGKAIAAVMDRTQPPAEPHPRGMLGHHFGVTGDVSGGLAMLRPGLEMHDGYLYAIWSTDKVPEESKRDGKTVPLIDFTIWERVKLSVYVAILEDEAEKRAAEEQAKKEARKAKRRQKAKAS